MDSYLLGIICRGSCGNPACPKCNGKVNDMLTVTLMGANFRPAEARAIVKELSIGDVLHLEADPNNEYDSTAVAVYSDDGKHHLGFIPRESNSALFAVLMDDASISAEVVAFESTLKPVLEIHFDRMPADEDDYALPQAPDGSTDGSYERHEDDFRSGQDERG